MGIVCAACATAAIGLWRGARWGYWLAFALLALNLTGDIINVAAGIEPKAAIGIPIALLLLAYLLSGRGRRFFAKPAR
jgi:uncharacterized membrane protein (DUF2068 family)